MALGKKTGGRVKGVSRNKKTLATERQRDEMRKHGLDPKDYVISVLNEPEKYDEIRYRAAMDLMEFYYPKLARNTVTGAIGIKNINDMTEEELVAFLAMNG